MNIALMAHDNRKELMVQFCTAYCGILAKHTLCATARTGQQIADATGLTIHRFLSFAHGGGQQIAARIAYNEIDMVLCFGDPNQKTPDADITYISRLCDQNNVPFASNLATAEMLVLGLDRGDLDWRDIVNPKNKPLYGLTTIGKSHTIRDNRADLAGVACTPPLQERCAIG